MGTRDLTSPFRGLPADFDAADIVASARESWWGGERRFNPDLSCLFFLALERGAAIHAGSAGVSRLAVVCSGAFRFQSGALIGRCVTCDGPAGGHLIVRYRVDYAHS